MLEKTITIVNATGLHARPATLFTQLAATFKSKIEVGKDGKFVDAKSILGVLTLGAGKNSQITIKTDGEDEEKALEALVNFIETHQE